MDKFIPNRTKKREKFLLHIGYVQCILSYYNL
jgi:hypothetical protein